MELHEAIRLKLPKYNTGRPCKRGHVADRLTSTRSCTECMRGVSTLWRKTNPERYKTYRVAQRNWRKEYNVRARDRMRAYYRKRAGIPEPLYPCPTNCECCGKLLETGKRTHLDHDHVTGKFRGWLCNVCNRGLGMFGDSIEGLERALRYLRR